MAGTWPTLSNGSIAMYPLVRTVRAGTTCVTFADDKEQRWRNSPILSGWELTISRARQVDRDAIDNFFDTQKGQFDSTWSFPFLGTTYTSLLFEDDAIRWTESFPKRFDTTLRIRQVKKNGTYATSGSAVYPTINNSVITQRPYSAGRGFRTVRNEMASGLQYVRADRAVPMNEWALAYPAVTVAEGVTLVDFFCYCLGMYRTFSFTDPVSGEVFANCRMGQDRIDMRYVGPGHCSTGLVVQEFAA